MIEKPILATTDLSQDDDRTVLHAALLARLHKTSLHLLHVLPAFSWELFGRALVEHPLITEKKLYDSARSRLNQMAEECTRQVGTQVKWHVDIGHAPEKIAEYVQTHGIGLTVFGPHEGNLVRDLFVGATALKTLRRTTNAILISVATLAKPYHRILVPVDFSPASRNALEFAMQFAPQVPVHVLHVVDMPYQGMMHYAGVEEDVIALYRKAATDEALQTLRRFIADIKGRGRMVPVVEYGSPARTILEQAEALHANLIVMGKQGRSEFSEFFLGSVTEEVLFRLDRDLLLVPGAAVP